MDYLFTWHQEVVGEPKENSGPHRGTVFVVLISISMVFLAIYGSQRRRRRSFIAQRFVRVAYLSSSLITYTLGSMQSSPVKSSMYPFWAVSLYILSGSAAYSITAYSLDENSRLMERTYQSLLTMCLCWVDCRYHLK
jgi:hypothetical protein